jgi:hypothetical protein
MKNIIDPMSIIFLAHFLVAAYHRINVKNFLDKTGLPPHRKSASAQAL